MHLLHSNAVATASLSPPHTYVPWIVINGQHDEDMQDRAQRDLFKVVCDTFVAAKPDVCREKKGIVGLFREMLVKLEVL